MHFVFRISYVVCRVSFVVISYTKYQVPSTIYHIAYPVFRTLSFVICDFSHPHPRTPVRNLFVVFSTPVCAAGGLWFVVYCTYFVIFDSHAVISCTYFVICCTVLCDF